MEEEQISKKKKTDYDLMAEHLKQANCRTLGEFFYHRLNGAYPDSENKLRKLPVRQRETALSSHVVDYAIPRYLVKDEFNLIWDNQAKYFSQMQKAGLKEQIYSVLFYEKAPAPYATGYCIYFGNEERLLKAHPLSEMRRIYESVNNIRLETDTGRKKLTTEQRDQIINELLLQGKNAGKKAIKAVLNLSNQIKISLDEDKIIKAYLYSTPDFQQIEYIKNLSQDELEKFVDFLANPQKDPNNPNSRLLNEDEIILKLKPILKVNDDKEIATLLTKLPKGRSMLGKSATKIILEKLKETGKTHREITDELAKTDPRFTAEEERARQMQGTCDLLPYYGKILRNDTQEIPPLIKEFNKNLNEDEKKYGRVANPAVHMILNQLRKVVNEIIGIYGKPYDINIELGRDVGLSTKKKNQKQLEQKQNEKLNEEAKKYLPEHHIYVNTKNILKYKLLKEQGWKDAYNPWKGEISQERPHFESFEIEHIIPRSRGGSDTYSNLCLVSRDDNLAKGNMFAYEYFEKTKTPEQIREILKFARERLQAKAWRFEETAREEYDDNGDSEETNRYLTDTRYVSKLAARYLRAIVDSNDADDVIHNRILAVKGTQTSTLRDKWYLAGLEYDLMGLNVPRYIPCTPYWVEQETGEIKYGTAKPDIDGNWRFKDKEKNPEWKKKPRIDHRHHAMDAITIACANRSLIQKMANEVALNHIEYPMPMTCVETVAEFREKVLNALKKVNVSHKPDHSKDGQLHKETVRVFVCEDKKKKGNLITYYYKNILNDIKTFADLDKLLITKTILDEWDEQIANDRKDLEELKNAFEKYRQMAESQLEDENRQDESEGKKAKPITEARILARCLNLIRKNHEWKNEKYKCYESNSALVSVPKHGVYYEGGNNYCVDFYEKDSKVGWEIINRFNANQKDIIPNWKQNDSKLIWSVQQSDVLELNTPEEWKSYTDKERCLARVKKFTGGAMTIDYISDARPTTKQKQDPDYSIVDSLTKGLTIYTKHKARKVELTPFGKIKRKHKVLLDGAKATT